MKKLLLHSCCGPCSSGVLEDLSKEYDITIYFYNPNIHPKVEYLKRLEAQEKLINKLKENGININLVVPKYNEKEYFDVVLGLENEAEGGKRCEKCFLLRMEEACKFAKDNNFDIFTTTLSISPHKDFKKLNEIGESLSKKYEIDYLWANFKKNDGYLKSIQNSKKFEIYRQDYCGCVYSNWHEKNK